MALSETLSRGGRSRTYNLVLTGDPGWEILDSLRREREFNLFVHALTIELHPRV